MMPGAVSFDRPNAPPDNRQDSRAQQEEKKKAEARRQALLQQIYASPQMLRNHVSMDQVVQGIQASEELLPIVAPQLAQAAPFLTVGYVGKDIYSAARDEYKATQNLPPWERFKKTAAKTGDVTLFNVLSTFLVPLAIFPPMKNRIEKVLKKPAFAQAKWLPGIIKRHPGFMTAVLLTPIGVVLAKPMDKMTNIILDLTYRPMVEKKKREQLLKEIREKQELVKKSATALQMQIPHGYSPTGFNTYYAYGPVYTPYAFGSGQQQQQKKTPPPPASAKAH